MVYDPYLEKGVLKNKFGIQDEEELRNAENDYSNVNIGDILEKNMKQVKTDYDFFISIHKFIFEDVYDWAGKIRIIGMSKAEPVLNGNTVSYYPPREIKGCLEYDINELNKIKWDILNKNEKTKKMADKILDIWEVHPFRDGNTRTVLVFANLFAKKNGFELNLLEKDNIRDSFAKAVYMKDKTELYKVFSESLIEKNSIQNSKDLEEEKRDPWAKKVALSKSKDRGIER